MAATGHDHWRKLEMLFQAASELAPDEQASMLDQACAGDPALRQEVEALLRSADRTLRFLEQPVIEAARDVTDQPGFDATRIGPYKIIRLLGQGGMGRVYLATRADDQYQQQVAIKLMHGGLGQSETMISRFRAERQILANLNHPNIARLLDGGVAADGSPYLVMDYVDGTAIDEFCRSGRLPLEQRLGLFRTVCGAIEYAHRNLVVHRDIKPPNILVTAEGVPKLLDFGIAKLLDPGASGDTAAPTRATERLMTPEYASPEQIRGETITTATDVYGLGVLLYELLTGQRPFRSHPESPLQIAQEVCETEPEPPSKAVVRDSTSAMGDARRLRGDLDNIVLTAMRKEPARRYPSAEQLSADIAAYLSGHPVSARTDTFSYRAKKFVGRHKMAVAAAGVMLLALIGFSGGMGVLAQRANQERLKAEREAKFLSDMFQAATPDVARGRTITARDLLDQGAQRIDRELAGEPGVRASLLDSLAIAYRSLGVIDQAKDLAERSYNLNLKTLGVNNATTGDSLFLLADLVRNQGRYREAEPLFRQALAIRQRILRHADLNIAGILSGLGECLYWEDRNSDAEQTLRQALVIYRRAGPDNGPEARNYLALVLERNGNYPEAVQLLQEAEQITKRTQGGDSPDYAISLHNLASALIDFGDLSGAEAKLRETLAIRRRVLGNRHQMLSYSLNNLGFLLLEKGDLTGAESFLKECLGLIREQLGEQNARVVAPINNLARLAQVKGDYKSAERGFRQALDILRNAGQGEGWSAANIIGNLGLLEFDRGNYAGSEKLARQALEMKRGLGGEETPAFAASLIEVAETRLYQSDPKAGEPLIEQALRIREKTFPAKNPSIIAAKVRLGEVRLAEGEAAEAEPVLWQALDEAHAAPFPLLPWQTAEAESALSACLMSLHRESEAEPLARDSRIALRTHPRRAFREPVVDRLANLRGLP